MVAGASDVEVAAPLTTGDELDTTTTGDELDTTTEDRAAWPRSPATAAAHPAHPTPTDNPTTSKRLRTLTRSTTRHPPTSATHADYEPPDLQSNAAAGTPYVHIAQVRKKVGVAVDLATVRGDGYRLDPGTRAECAP